jgi:hypothetical protein
VVGAEELRAYFDVAGAAHRSGVMAIAGFVSDARKWRRFEDEWNAILHKESVSQLHMTDFVSRRGEFAGWKNQSERSGRFVSDLITCTKRYVNKAFGGSIVLADYATVNNKYHLQEFGGYPYSLCGQYAVSLVKKWQKKHQIREVIFAFEKGDQHQHDLERLCGPDGVVPKFLMKREATPFQAADLFAWRTRDAFEKALDPISLTAEKVERLNERFGQTWGHNRHEAFYGDRIWLERFCVGRGIARRATPPDRR